MIVMVNLMMKSGAALTVYHETPHTMKSAEEQEEIFSDIMADGWQRFGRDKKLSHGTIAVDMREVR